jgi:hypothetical protein
MHPRTAGLAKSVTFFTYKACHRHKVIALLRLPRIMQQSHATTPTSVIGISRGTSSRRWNAHASAWLAISEKAGSLEPVDSRRSIRCFEDRNDRRLKLPEWVVQVLYSTPKPCNRVTEATSMWSFQQPLSWSLF